MKRNVHIGSDFDDFLREEAIFDEAQAVAVKEKRVRPLPYSPNSSAL